VIFVEKTHQPEQKVQRTIISIFDMLRCAAPFKNLCIGNLLQTFRSAAADAGGLKVSPLQKVKPFCPEPGETFFTQRQVKPFLHGTR
jgi:hypothetical protein